ncbi:uncharacterized protein LOC116920300 [Daphnia magna]|uniref:Uncharacterized protein n=2 Tax=Daphnia magna TaxID=35525 RepID=A0ABQ9YW75_9CRUS|nr:uncharacterized protein LOC116920300 [Daphnia magna]KAK4004728.1 hypothetical protein OUZ56_006454 [Daphnia magna]KZS17912.1 Uncharacterized protein APZ42_015908 [Daphnia magna]
MASSLKSLSQIWNKNPTSNVNAEDINHTSVVHGSGSRRQLSRQFKSVSDTTRSQEQPTRKMLLRGRGVLSSISNLNVANVPKETRKLIQAGADKVNQTLNGVRSTFGTWSQKLKNNPTRRRQRLVNSSPYTPGRGKDTPKSKQLLGRTPTKLYSPFGIETPSSRRQRNRQNFYGKPGTYTPTRAASNKQSGNSSSNFVSGPAFNAVSVYSPTQAFPKDVQHVRQGVEDFNRAAEGVVRRSLRQQMSTAHL